MRYVVRAAALFLAVGGLGVPALAGGPRTLVVRDGLTAEQLEADGAVCLEEAKAAERANPSVRP